MTLQAMGRGLRPPALLPAAKAVRITPVAGFFAVVTVTNLLSVPMAYLLNAQDFEFIEYRVTHDDVLRAYWWTIYAFAALVGLYFLLGVHRMVGQYQVRAPVLYSDRGYETLWTVTLIAGLSLSVVLFVQAGFRIPLLTVLGADYVRYATTRLYFELAINGTVFNIALYWAATANLAVAWLHLKSPFRMAVSAGLFVLVGSFDLARSPVGLALLMLLAYRLLWTSISWKQLLKGVGVMGGFFLLAHYVAGAPTGYGGMGEYLGVRIFYGQWAGLPYYFSLFEHDRVPWASLFGSALHVLQSNTSAIPEGPARIVMERMSPDGIIEGRAGVASAFFIGEAYAVAGIAGVVVAPVLVMLQVGAIVVCFRRLEKTTLNMLLYSWFLFKVFMGIVSGFSEFVTSLLQVMILVLVYWVMISGLVSRAARAIAQQRPRPRAGA